MDLLLPLPELDELAVLSSPRWAAIIAGAYCSMIARELGAGHVVFVELAHFRRKGAIRGHRRST